MVPSLAVKKKQLHPQPSLLQLEDSHESSPAPSNSSQMSVQGKRKSSEEPDLGPDKEKKRKLMNRVAAQQSRDRKRLYLDNLEKEIKKLKSENAALKATNLFVEEEKERLKKENLTLKSQTMCIKEEASASVAEISSSVTPESAAFTNGPQQQEQVTLALILCLMQFLHILPVRSSPSHSSQMNSLVFSKRFGKISVEELIRRHLRRQRRSSQRCQKWWGPQQQSWNPSKNSCSLALPS